jgi:hypothetical protein
MSASKLQNFFNFDQSDLVANQNGKFSAKQERRLKEIEKNTSKTFRFIGIGLILLNLCIVGGIISNTLAEGFSFSTASTEDIFGVIIAIVFPTFILGAFVWFMFWVSSSKAVYSLKKVQGEINFVKVEKQESYKSVSGSTSYRTVQKYELRVGQTKFHDVAEELLNLIKVGDTYIFYYIKDTKDILSCELIKESK